MSLKGFLWFASYTAPEPPSFKQHNTGGDGLLTGDDLSNPDQANKNLNDHEPEDALNKDRPTGAQTVKPIKKKPFVIRWNRG